MNTRTLRRQRSLFSPVLILAGLALALLAGCDQQGSAEQAGRQIDRAVENAEQQIDQAKDQAEKDLGAARDAAADQAQSAGDAVDDAGITAKVKSALLIDPLLKGSSIEVSTVSGVVTLRGTVHEEPDIARAIEVANTQRGVKGVQSELIVQQVK